MTLVNHPHKKREPFPGQGERLTEIRLQAKVRCCDDVMIMKNNFKKQYEITLQTKRNKMTLTPSTKNTSHVAWCISGKECTEVKTLNVRKQILFCQTFLRPNYNIIEGGQDESSFESIRSPIQMQSTAKL